MITVFEDRRQAGKQLSQRLTKYTDRDDVVVLGLARGGLLVAFEVAQALDAPLDVFIVRKLGVPGHRELAMGAIASGGVRVMNDSVVHSLRISDDQIEAIAKQEAGELQRREQEYRGHAEMIDVINKTVILADDGMATGASMRAAVAALRQRGPARIVVAVPTAAPSACKGLADAVDELVCLTTPEPFLGVGAWYRDFSQTTDGEVRRLLELARKPTHAQGSSTKG